jgi:hypothetical protein
LGCQPQERGRSFLSFFYGPQWGLELNFGVVQTNLIKTTQMGLILTVRRLTKLAIFST